MKLPLLCSPDGDAMRCADHPVDDEGDLPRMPRFAILDEHRTRGREHGWDVDDEGLLHVPETRAKGTRRDRVVGEAGEVFSESRDTAKHDQCVARLRSDHRMSDHRMSDHRMARDLAAGGEIMACDDEARDR